LCSDVIDVEVVFNFDIKDIDLLTGGLLSGSGLFSGLLLSILDQLLLCLHLHLNKLALSAGGLGLLRLLL
jgi:hypothetical protein